MNFGDFLHSKRWHLIQNYIYSWGASVVLIGALFKLEHLKFASVFLGVGLSIEAIIFFISAFEPLMELPDWKRVYPQMRTGHEDEKEKGLYKRLDDLHGTAKKIDGGGGSVSIKDIPEEQIKKLNESFRRLAETADGLKQMSSATVATESFVKNLSEASASIGKVVGANEKVSHEMEKGVKEITSSYQNAANSLVNSSEKASQGIVESISELSQSYKIAAGTIKTTSDKAASEIGQTTGEFNSQLKNSINEINSTYKSMTATVTTGFKSLDKNSGKYAENIEKLNKNLASLNASYELQLQGAGKVDEMVSEYSKGVSEVSKLLQKSVEETRKFNDSTKEINENIQALNKVYGNMLGALNVKR